MESLAWSLGPRESEGAELAVGESLLLHLGHAGTQGVVLAGERLGC